MSTCEWLHRPENRPPADGHLTLVYTAHGEPDGERAFWAADLCARHRRTIVKAAVQLHRHRLIVNEWEPLPDEDPDEPPLRERQ